MWTLETRVATRVDRWDTRGALLPNQAKQIS